MEPNIKEFVNSLLKTQITDNLKLTDKEKKLNQQTGLICFLQGYCLETGFQVQPNMNQAVDHYNYGLCHFADPLCAMQLEHYYTKQKKKTLAAFCKTIYYLLIDLIYDLKHSLKKVEISNYEESLNQIAPTTNLPLQHLKQFLKALYLLKESGQQSHYDQLLEAFSNMGTKIHAYPIMLRQFTQQTNNPNKCPDELFQLCQLVNPQPYLVQCLFNISLHGMSENSHLNAIRSIIFELSFLHRPDPYPEVVEQLYLRQTQSVLHRILLIRKHAKAKKSYDIQEEELKFIDQSKTPISFYMIGKRQIDKSRVCHLCKAKELLNNPWPQDPFVTFVYLFYKAKLELHHQHHDGFSKLIDINLFEDCKSYYDRNHKIFKQVRTLQFYSIRCRVDKQRDKIAYKNKQIQAMFDQKRLQILEQSRSSFHLLQQSQISLRKSYVNQSPTKIENIKQTQSIFLDAKSKHFDRTIKGPLILQNTEQQYSNQSRFVELENKVRFNKLNLIKSEDINDVQFLSKSNRDGLISIGKYHGQNVFIKTLGYMNYDQISQYFKLAKKYASLEHQNLRTIIGYNIEDLQEVDLSGHIRMLAYKYEYNLRTFLNRNQISTKEKWHMAIQIIDATYYLHQHEISFCNLNPNNILIESENYIPILIDFDLPFDKDYLDNRYTHKSIIEEDMPLFTEQQDIYSIGCVLLYLFFGCEFQFKNILHSTTVSLEMFQTINPHQSQKVEFQLQPGSEALEERARLIIQKCLDGEIEMLDLLQQFYDHA